MTISRPAIVRLTAVSAVALGLVLGMISAQDGMISGLSDAASLHRLSNGKIAFLGGFADGSLAVINPDGSGLRRLARCPARGWGVCSAVWSPDGRRIAFVGDRATNHRIDHYPAINMSVYVVNANGSGEHRVASWGQGYIACWGEALT